MKIVIFINLMCSVFFLWLFYERYYKYQHLFENGRYFDGEHVLTDNNFVYIIPAILFFIIAGVLSIRKLYQTNKTS